MVKKTTYDKFVAKENTIDTSGFILKTQYNNSSKKENQ